MTEKKLIRAYADSGKLAKIRSHYPETNHMTNTSLIDYALTRMLTKKVEA